MCDKKWDPRDLVCKNAFQLEHNFIIWVYFLQEKDSYCIFNLWDHDIPDDKEKDMHNIKHYIRRGS